MEIREHIGEKISDINVVAKIFKEILQGESEIDRNKEHFWVAGVNVSLKIIYIELVSLGGLTCTVADPREIFRLAIFKGAAAIIAVHNHPSGNLDASEDDRKVTKRLAKAGEILEIKLLDHIIINSSGGFSHIDVIQEP